MNLPNKKSILKLGLFSISALLWTSPSQASDTDIVEQLKSCARMEQDANRIACYEQLGKSVVADDTQTATEVVSTQKQMQVVDAAIEAEQAKPNVLPESLGGGDFSDRSGRKIETYRGRVTSCKKASDRKWFYIFENGQAWKQVDSRKRSHRNCDFMVTVTKDSFGYKMVIDGQDSKIRIDRRR